MDGPMVGIMCLVLAWSAYGAAGLANSPGHHDAPVVHATEGLNVDPLNRSMEEALAAGQDWPTQPLAAAAMLTGFSTQVASMTIAARWAGPEGTGPVTVVTVSDGALDDSLRGEWRQYVFDQGDDGTWRLVGAERAWRCWRGQDDFFATELCP